jgi:hypothetical protein
MFSGLVEPVSECISFFHVSYDDILHLAAIDTLSHKLQLHEYHSDYVHARNQRLDMGARQRGSAGWSVQAAHGSGSDSHATPVEKLIVVRPYVASERRNEAAWACA